MWVMRLTISQLRLVVLFKNYIKLLWNVFWMPWKGFNNHPSSGIGKYVNGGIGE
jgi:hypothetical protein